MKTLLHCLMVLSLALGLITTACAETPADPKALDAMVGKALEAYNVGNHTAFYADFAKLMASVTTEQTFNVMYRGMYFTTYGKYVSRTSPVKAETVLLGDSPLLVYVGRFEKNEKVKISVNFMKEEGAFKIMQIQLAPL
jgi:hypothetical protein